MDPGTDANPVDLLQYHRAPATDSPGHLVDQTVEGRVPASEIASRRTLVAVGPEERGEHHHRAVAAVSSHVVTQKLLGLREDCARPAALGVQAHVLGLLLVGDLADRPRLPVAVDGSLMLCLEGVPAHALA